MALDDAGDDVARGRSCGSTPLSLQVSISEAITAQCSAPPSEPANRAFLRFSAIGRMVRSTMLVSISMRPSSRKRLRPAQREQRVADGLGELGLLADQRELALQPRLERFDERPAASPGARARRSSARRPRISASIA